MPAAAAEGEDSPAGLGDRAKEERVLFQPDHGTGKGQGPGQCVFRALESNLYS